MGQSQRVSSAAHAGARRLHARRHLRGLPASEGVVCLCGLARVSDASAAVSRAGGRRCRFCARATMQRTQAQGAQLQGKLYKLGHGFRGRTWNKRYFVLSGQTLAYYSSQEDSREAVRPHKVLDLTGCRVEDKGFERWSGRVRLPPVPVARDCWNLTARVWQHGGPPPFLIRRAGAVHAGAGAQRLWQRAVRQALHGQPQP